MKWYHYLGLGALGIFIWKASSKASAAEVPQDNIIPLSPPAVIDAATKIAVDTIKANPEVPPGAVVDAVADATAEVTAPPPGTSFPEIVMCYAVGPSSKLSGIDPAVRIGLLEKQLAAGRVSAATAQRIRGAFGLGGWTPWEQDIATASLKDLNDRLDLLVRNGWSKGAGGEQERIRAAINNWHPAPPVTAPIRIPVSSPSPMTQSVTSATTEADWKAAAREKRDREFKELMAAEERAKIAKKAAAAAKVAAAMAAAARNVSFAVVRPVRDTAITRR